MNKITPDLFSYDLLRMRKSRAGHTLEKASYLVEDLETSLCRRLPQKELNGLRILVIGCPGGGVAMHLTSLNPSYLNPFELSSFKESALPYADQTFDIVVEGFIFHWLNDPLAYLMEIKRLLKPDGHYLAGFLGGSTLMELRQVLIETDLALYQGAFARVSPMIKPEAATRLLQSAGFKDPVVDHEEVHVRYPHVKELVQDLRWMGETNALVDQRSPKITKDYLEKAEGFYRRLYPSAGDTITATFDCVYMTGWFLQ